MSKKANKTLIGVFVVAAIVMLVAAVLIFGSGKFFRERIQYVAFFEGSVNGLGIGAPVMFRGVKLGEVNDILLVYHAKELSFEIPVCITLFPEKVTGMALDYVEADEDREYHQLLEQGLRAQLQLQSLVTGQLAVELDFHPDSPLKLYGFKDLNLGPDVKEIPTIKSGFQELGRKIEQLPLDDIAADLRSSLQGINAFVNSPEFGKSLHYFKQVLRDARNFVRHLDSKVDPLYERVDGLLANLDNQIEPLATSLIRTSDDTDKLILNVNKRIGPIHADLNKTAASLRAALKSAESALNEVDEMIEDDSEVRYYIDVFLREMTMAARSVRALANYLERNPDALLRGKVSKTSQEEGR